MKSVLESSSVVLSLRDVMEWVKKFPEVSEAALRVRLLESLGAAGGKGGEISWNPVHVEE